MCGIAGVIGCPYDHIVMQKMLDTMHRRGPDENGANILAPTRVNAKVETVHEFD